MTDQKSKKEEVDQNSILPLHPKEVDLILRLRNKYKFGEVTIKVRDGIPWTIEKTTVTEHLGIF